MGMARKLLQGLTRRAVTKTMDRVGGKLVSRIADTSADAPSAFHEPKRDLYRHMVAGEAPARAPSNDSSAEPASSEPAPSEHDGHDHDHGHEG